MTQTPKVLWIGWDAADWKIIHPLIEAGEMPNLEQMINRGVMGNLPTMKPVLSPMLWNTMATGKPPDQHGILGFATVDDATNKVRPFGSVDRKAKAIWNILSQEGFHAHVVSWFCGHPAEPLPHGVCVTEALSRQIMEGAPLDAKFLPGAVHPEHIEESLAPLRVRPQDIDDATMGLFVRELDSIDQEKDPRLEVIAKQLSECFTIHSATTWILETQPWDFVAAYYPTIDHLCHGFMKYHPPRQAHVNEREFELFGDVINSCYRMHDVMLGRLLELAGDNATVFVCSDHGFHSDHLRPRSLPNVFAAPAAEHRDIGMLAMQGPGLKRDELIHGAALLDLAPTMLSLFGLPMGEDMPGRVLVEAFEEPPRIETIPSWETIEGEAGMPEGGFQLGDEDSQALLQQFAALGYIDPQAASGNDDEAVEATRTETQWNLSRVYTASGRFRKALPILEEIYERYPLRFDFGLALAECQARLGLVEEARELATNLAAAYPDRPRARMILGFLECQAGHPKDGLDHLREAAKSETTEAAVFLHLGEAWLAVGDVPAAADACRRALEIDPDHPAGHLGEARCLLLMRQPEEAAGAALQAIDAEFRMPRAHYLLGIALARLGYEDRSIQAFETCLQFAPQHFGAHRHLQRLYEKRTEDQDAAAKATHHRQQAAGAKEARQQRQSKIAEIRQEAATRSATRRAEYDARDAALAKAMEDETAPPLPAGSLPEQVTPGSSGKCFIIVSGLPRSGTSLMMQILEAGGLEPMTDRDRVADQDNPKGYYEWEAVKQLARNPHLIEQAEGKATKVISMLLPKLPPVHRYKIIFMDRPAAEVAASQARMLERSGREGSDRDPEKLAAMLENHRAAILKKLENLPQVELLRLSYPALIKSPEPELARLTAFVGKNLLPTPAAMPETIDPSLYRNRAARENNT